MLNQTDIPRQVSKSKEGVVLMELILVVGVFFVLIGASMWLGDIALARCKLMVADRYALWNAGNRHFTAKSSIQGIIQSELFAPDRVFGQRVTDVAFERGLAEHWYFPVGATVFLEMEMPIWTKGWLSGAVLLGQTESGRIETFTGRSPTAVDGPPHAAMLARSPFSDVGYRTLTPEELAAPSNPWEREIALQPYQGTGTLAPTSAGGLLERPAKPNPGILEEFQRHGDYQRWSQ